MQQLTQLLQKYKDQSATEAELHELLLLLDKQEEKLLFEWMDGNNQQSGLEDTKFDKQKIRSAIMHKISASTMPELKSTPAKRTTNRAYTISATMAAACICIMIIVGVINQTENSTKKNAVAESIPGQPGTQAFYAQDKSQRIILKDSSSVLLYPGSSLEYRGSYNTTDRQLLLKGNALFKVKKDPDRPFIVTTRHSSTTALGTIFEVNEWKDSTTVFLSEGRVKVHAADNQNKVLFLEPGDRAITYRGQTWVENNLKGKSKIDIQTKDVPSLIKGKTATLVFKQTPLTQVLATLETRYHVTIQFGDEELSGLLFTGVINEDDKIEDVLAIIATVHKLVVSSHEQGFSINK